MSQRLIARSPDLARLRSEGYDIAVSSGYLIVRDVPYVTRSRTVTRGVLYSQLDAAGDQTVTPTTHVVSFAGETPCSSDGTPLKQLIHSTGRKDLGTGTGRTSSSRTSRPPGTPTITTK